MASFILSDETENSHGYRVLTDGIDTTRFLQNPVMYFNHDRENIGVIGRWENVRKENGRLIADAVFNENCETGKRVKEDVENGFLNAVSIGINIIEWDEKNGITVATKCELLEASIVDIPSNANATRITDKEKGNLRYLTFNRSKNIEVLNLEKFLSLGAISDIEYLPLMALARSDKKAFSVHLEKVKDNFKQKITSIVNKGIDQRKIMYKDKDLFVEIGLSLGVEKLKRVFVACAPYLRVTDFIKESGDEIKNLDWYRRNDPRYLKEHPEKYKELIEREQNRY